MPNVPTLFSQSLAVDTGEEGLSGKDRQRKYSKMIETLQKSESKPNENDFEARDYQTQLFEEALKRNIIIFLPTGCGKTFIAYMLIKEMSRQTEKKYTEGGKRSIFLVCTVALAHQQAEYLKRMRVPCSVGTYTGDMGVDFWKESRWLQELDKNQVLVMTAQIFLDMLHHSYISMDKLNLIILDECHHAVNKHAMSRIMELYMTLPPENKPRILGLTATLLNANVKLENITNEIHDLEITLQAKICRAKDEKMLNAVSTNPKEEIIYYHTEKPPEILKLCGVIGKCIEDLTYYVGIVQPDEEETIEMIMSDGTELIKNRKTESQRVKNMLKDVQNVADENGPFAASYALLARLFNLERLKISSTDLQLNQMYCMCITAIHKLRKLLRICMESYSAVEQPITFSSPKLVKLIDALRDFPAESSAIIFVTRRITAQSLFYVFKFLATHCENFKNVKPDFIVGVNSNPYNLTREPEFERKKNKETMERFNKRITNVLFASSVVEEGIDVRHCNYVIKYDHPDTFCSYIQSKGRARKEGSKFIMMVPFNADSKKPFSKEYEKYKKAEQILLDELKYEKSMTRRGGTEQEGAIRNIYSDIPDGYEPFYVDGPNSAVLTLGSSISLLNRYCSSLPSDKFTALTVTYWKKEIDDKKIVYLQLPMNSPIKEVIEGKPCRTLESAKASAAFEACKQLYFIKELNSKLLPVGPVFEIEDEDFFPLWDVQDESYACNKAKPGTKKCIRVYDKKVPKWMNSCTPKPDKKTYIHLIKITPVYACQNTNRLRTFYNLLNSSNTFALLTSKEWPNVCEFPMFLNVGEVNIKVENNFATKNFTKKELKEIFDFHCLLVTKALPMRKNFLVKDWDDGEYSYYIAPVLETSGGVQIDWKTIREHKTIPTATPMPEEMRRSIVVNDEKYYQKVVIPWYRPADFKLRYIVTNVCEDMTPLSPFPSEHFNSYAHYFNSRYNQKIFNDKQSLIEVRPISQKRNCLLPRRKPRLGKRKKRDEEELDEILVPELCFLLEFPAVYLLKVTLIPSVMHRLAMLFLAEELRLKIASEVGLGKVKLPPSFVWEKLKADETAFNIEEERPTQMKSTIEVSNMLATEIESLHPNDCPWDKDEEPCDIDRNLETVDLISIIMYDKFATKKLDLQTYENSSSPGSNYGGSRNKKEYNRLFDSVPVPEISFLKLNKNSYGPQLNELVQIFVSNAGNDIINYERLETLGDSFLKFLACIILFTKYPTMDEGKLTYLKGKLVGNRNLFYAGRNLELGSMLKVNDFIPDDWDIPHYKLLDVLSNLLKNLKASPCVLFDLNLSEEEIETSLLSEKSYNHLLELLSKDEDPPGTGYHILRQEAVADKLVADSVEALIGVYLKSCGIEGAFKLCQWLQLCKLIPQDDESLEDILYNPAPSAHLNPSLRLESYLINADDLERRLGYKFKDRSFLLQAVTHSSFAQYATDCYQRLEFLGDAILDFLITCHIYNKCENLGPGELTDLRSALVNNVTFACLAVRYGFDQFILSKAMLLSKAIATFSEQQEKRNHKIGAEVFLLVNESDVKIGEMIEVPKILGDVFESLAGAVFLDSGKSLQTVWNVFYRLMHNEINEFSKNVPKNNIRLLYEKFPNPTPIFKKVEWDQKSQLMKVIITNNGETKEFYGYGSNTASAKMAAAKLALRHYHGSD